MPASEAFLDRLVKGLPRILDNFPTPFHVYDEIGIRETVKKMTEALTGLDFRNYYAVKANANLRILEIMRDIGCGFDCSSVPELRLVRQVGAYGDDIMFTSNNTLISEFEAALANGGCIVNLDDEVLLPKLLEASGKSFPETVCFRYNPGNGVEGNAFIGKPAEAKYGLRPDQIIRAYAMAREAGAKRFGLHTMIVSNERNHRAMAATVDMICGLAKRLKKEEGIKLDFINAGGGIGVAYKPEDPDFDLDSFGCNVRKIFGSFQNQWNYQPRFFLECGRYLTASHGILVSKVANVMEKHRLYIGLDACMSNLMRPALYGAYHHIEFGSLVGSCWQPRTDPRKVMDVVGSLCENNDKFAVDRLLAMPAEGDIALIHESGGHGFAMGFQYNGRLRSAEFLLRADGSIELIRRAETYDDYIQTMTDFQSISV